MKHLNKVLFGLGCFVLLAFSLTGRVNAASAGTCGANLKWNLDDAGKLTISGTGEMSNYSLKGKNRAPWAAGQTVDTTVRSLVIENGVESIGSYAFEACTALGSVSLPESLKTIGQAAFKNDVSLKAVVIPANVEMINQSAFEACTGLAAVGITGPVANLGGSTFKGCTSLTSIVIPTSVQYINTSTFEGCTALKSVKFVGNYLWHIGIYAFKGCISLSDIVLPESVKEIDAGAFAGCVSLTDFTIPGRVTDLKANTFVQCLSLKTVTLGQGVKTLETGTFVQCPKLSTIIIPKSVKKMGKGVFAQCGLTKVNYVGTEKKWKKIKGISHAFDGVKPKIKYGYASPVKSITISDKTYKLAKKQSYQLLVKVNPVYAPQKIEWETSNFSVLSVNSNGYITGYKAGTSTVTAKCGSKEVKCKVTVYNPVKTIKFTKSKVSVKVGKKLTLTTKITPKDAPKDGLKYSSSNPKVAKVSSKGVVEGVSKGTAKITVTAPSGKKGTCKVKVS